MSISVNEIVDNEDVKSEHDDEKNTKPRPKATTYGKITHRSQSIRVRKVEEINLNNLRGDSTLRLDEENSPLKDVMKKMNKAQLARYEKMLHGDAGTKSMNIPRLGFKFDLKTTEEFHLRKRQDSGSDSHNSNDIELLFPEQDV